MLLVGISNGAVPLESNLAISLTAKCTYRITWTFIPVKLTYIYTENLV